MSGVSGMGSAGLEFLVGLLEDQQRRSAAAEAAAKKAAQQAQQAQQGGGQGSGGEAGSGGCGAQRPAASPEQQQGARQCAAAGDQQRAQAVGDTGCQARPEQRPAEQPRAARGVEQPYQDVEGADEAIAAEQKRQADAVQRQMDENHPERVPAAPAEQAQPRAYQDVEGADEAIAAEQQRQADAVQRQMNENHPERAPAEPAKNEKLAKVLAANPGIKTNQDLINHLYKQGGGTWEGAVQQARAAGVKMTDLIADRQGDARARVDAAPGTTKGADTAKGADTTKGAQEPEGPSSVPDQKQYKPGSPEQVALFKEAARKAGLPESWASSPALQNILRRESDGVVGRPNYTYGARAKDPSQWDDIHNELKNGQKTAKSSATGLGQLLLSNVDKYYPSGRAGIGNPVEEAAGMMAYIKDRYGSPERAWALYGKLHEGY